MRTRIARKNLYLYIRLLSKQLRALMSYQTDFMLSMLAMVVTQGLGLLFLHIVYQKIPSIHGWSFWEVVFIYALVILTEGMGAFFCNGMWVIGGLVNKGEFDRILIRPISPMVQMFTSNIGIGGIGSIVMGGIMLVQAMSHADIIWSFSKLVWLFLFLLSAVAIRVSIILAACCQVFWTGSANTSFAHTIHTLGELAKYPISIYSIGIQCLITIVVPYAFISFFPAAFLFGKSGWEYYGWLAPLVAIYAMLASMYIFQRGLAKYESAGH